MPGEPVIDEIVYSTDALVAKEACILALSLLIDFIEEDRRETSTQPIVDTPTVA